MTLAIAIHALMLFWNPELFASHYKPIHDFVTIDVVEQPAPGGYQQPEAPKKMSLMETLTDMLMKPKTEDIAHVAPEPLTHRVAAPVQPALQEKTMPHSIASMFQPKSQSEDLASASAPNAIQTQNKNFAIPQAGPTLQSKSFGGIRAKDLPFQVGTDQQIAGNVNTAVIPVAVGNNSAKAALGYSGPTLADSGKHMGIHPSLSGPAGNVSALGGGGPSTIQLSGTGGTGNAPTGATQGSVLQDRAGSGGGGGLVSRGMFGGGGAGGGIGTGVEGIPSAAKALDAELGASAGGSAKAKGKKGFDIAGPLNNRPILHKVIPQYPAWAEEQGIIGSVRIWFTVTADGSVRSNMRVTKTTGYPDLDKLALDALKEWRFAVFNTADESSQWGIITFTFSLSS
jgi:TonB family protein